MLLTWVDPHQVLAVGILEDGRTAENIPVPMFAHSRAYSRLPTVQRSAFCDNRAAKVGIALYGMSVSGYVSTMGIQLYTCRWGGSLLCTIFHMYNVSTCFPVKRFVHSVLFDFIQEFFTDRAPSGEEVGLLEIRRPVLPS